MTRPGTTSDRERHNAAAISVQLALDSIQEAQRLGAQAVQALSAVAGMRSERKRVDWLAQRLTWAWFAVSAAANRIRRRATPPAPSE